jgi:ketosteroid isomerase-like protein
MSGATDGAGMTMPRTAHEARRFGEAWARTWNARDVEAMLAHYADDVTFHSPMAGQVAGSPTLHGKTALRTYWMAALQRIGRLRFTVEQVLFDPEQRDVAIFYLAELDDRRTRACERLRFGPDGLATLGDAYYGAAVTDA